MKKLLILALSAAMALTVFTACRSNVSESTDGRIEDTQTTRFTGSTEATRHSEPTRNTESAGHTDTTDSTQGGNSQSTNNTDSTGDTQSTPEGTGNAGDNSRASRGMGRSGMGGSNGSQGAGRSGMGGSSGTQGQNDQRAQGRGVIDRER